MVADNELKKELLHEAHNFVFTMHPGGNKIVSPRIPLVEILMITNQGY